MLWWKGNGPRKGTVLSFRTVPDQVSAQGKGKGMAMAMTFPWLAGRWNGTAIPLRSTIPTIPNGGTVETLMAADDQFTVLFTSYTNVTLALSGHVACANSTLENVVTACQAHEPRPKPACLDPNAAHNVFACGRSERLSSCSDILQLGSGYRRCQSVQEVVYYFKKEHPALLQKRAPVGGHLEAVEPDCDAMEGSNKDARLPTPMVESRLAGRKTRAVLSKNSFISL
jgi:hypothetical protein